MRGHEAIIQMRSGGRKPGFVFINDFPCKTNWAEWGEYATVCIDGDCIADIDLRFATGLRVSISAATERRAKNLFEMAKAAGATAIGCCHAKHDGTGWTQVWHKGENNG